MPERARTDPWEPQGSNPLGPPGPELDKSGPSLRLSGWAGIDKPEAQTKAFFKSWNDLRLRFRLVIDSPADQKLTTHLSPGEEMFFIKAFHKRGRWETLAWISSRRSLRSGLLFPGRPLRLEEHEQVLALLFALGVGAEVVSLGLPFHCRLEIACFGVGGGQGAELVSFLPSRELTCLRCRLQGLLAATVFRI